MDVIKILHIKISRVNTENEKKKKYLCNVSEIENKK